MNSLNWADYAVIGIIAISALVSVVRGFVREALSLGAWVLAFWLAWTYFRDVAVQLEPWVDTQSLRLGIGFVVVLLGTLLLAGGVNFLILKAMEKSGLSGTDRMIGLLFGAARGLLLVTVLVLVARLTPLPQDSWWSESRLLVYFDRWAVELQDQLPRDVARHFEPAADREPTPAPSPGDRTDAPVSRAD